MDEQDPPKGSIWPGAGRDGQRVLLTGLALAYLLVQVALVFQGVNAPVAKGAHHPNPYAPANYGFAMGIGLLVGATELIARYRDKPFEPLLSSAGLFYMLINAGAAAFAYYSMLRLNVLGSQWEVTRVLTAGLTAMAFFRSGLFKVRIAGDDVTVGPNLVLQILLDALDRTYDRERATPRSAAVRDIMAGVSFDVARKSLPRLCFNLMQNVSEAERSGLDLEIKAIGDSDASDDAKALTLGLTLLNLVGEQVLRAAIDALGRALQGFSRIGQDLTDRMAMIDPDLLVDKLPMVCNEIAHPKIKLASKDDVAALVAGIKAQDLPAISKAFETLIVMIGRFGEQTVSAALKILPIVETPRVGAPAPSPSPTPTSSPRDESATEANSADADDAAAGDIAADDLNC